MLLSSPLSLLLLLCCCNNNSVAVWGLSSTRTQPKQQQQQKSTSSRSSSTSSWMKKNYYDPRTTLWYSNTVHVLEHLFSSPFESINKVSLEDITNTRIPGGPKGSGIEILSYIARPKLTSSQDKRDQKKLPVLILIHEFFGLNESIVNKANALADDLGCIVVAPDTFRGVATTFIPKAIWLALSTPTTRVNDDLDAICTYLDVEGNNMNVDLSSKKLAVMGFCYGGGKAIQYTTTRKPNAATVIFYGQPVTDITTLQKLNGPVCGIYGRDDIQFPMKLINQFQLALQEAKVDNTIAIYDNVGHAFWKDMDQIRAKEKPQIDAYNQCTTFLRNFFFSG